MEALKTSRFDDLTLEVVNGDKLRVEISRDALASIKDKNYVYSSFSYFVPLYEEDINVKPVSRYVYFNLPTNVESLDSVRVNMGKMNIDEERDTREKIMRGLLSLYYLVSEGKIFNIPINPLNYVLSKDSKVMAFYREDEELGEITDEWLQEFKKLLAFYLVTNSAVVPEKYNDYTIPELTRYMSTGVKRGFETLYNCMSINEMLEIYISDRTDIKALQNFYPLLETFQKPIDITSDTPMSASVLNSEPDLSDAADTEYYEPQNAKGKNTKKIKKQRKKDVSADKGKIQKKRRLEAEKNANSKRKKNAAKYEPNEAKRKAMEPIGKSNNSQTVKYVLILLVLFALVGGYFFGGQISTAWNTKNAQQNVDFTQVYLNLKQWAASQFQ